jgi:hypothetical protein
MLSNKNCYLIKKMKLNEKEMKGKGNEKGNERKRK